MLVNVVDTDLEAFLLSTHNICFHEEIRNIQSDYNGANIFGTIFGTMEICFSHWYYEHQ